MNSLGLTEQQPENNVYRILFGMLGVTLSKSARARAVQLPAWNEALGLPRPFDQQWSLRLQQIGAFETDMLDYEDIFDGSKVIEEKVALLCGQIRGEIARIESKGGAASQSALEYMKERLVASNAARIEAIETGEEIRVGVNAYTETEASPLTEGDANFVTVDRNAESQQIERLNAWRAGRDAKAVEGAGGARRRGQGRDQLLASSIACAKAGVTTGEWAGASARYSDNIAPPPGLPRMPRPQRRAHRGLARRGRCGIGQTRPQIHLPGRQARARRPFQRRRADRHPCPRCGDGRDL